MSRIEAIKKLLARNANDAFLVYSLAMEHASAGQVELATEQFQRCLRIDPEYLAAYTECGKALRSAGRLAEARRMFQAGVELAARLGKAHDRDYLQQQLDSLPGQG